MTARIRERTPPARPLVGALALCISAGLHAQPPAPVTQSDWGGAGLLQTPSARMVEAGDVAFTATHVSPYNHYNISAQPFDWLETTVRYSHLSNLDYGPETLSGDQTLKTQSIDFKVRLLRESRWTPELAVGALDFGGTGPFSSEYIVANKRFGAIDVSLGLATGYLGHRGDFGNPIGAVNDRFDTRQDSLATDHYSSNSFDLSQMLRGRVGLFGGVSYQTPWTRLLLKLEYDGNDYQREPRGTRLDQDSAWNLGTVYTINDNVRFSLGWERGDTVSVGLTLRTNLANLGTPAKTRDPAPVPLVQDRPAPIGGLLEAAIPAGPYRDAAERRHAERQYHLDALSEVDWTAVARQLDENAGIDVEDISLRGRELVVTGEQTRYPHMAQGLGRTARILDQVASPEIEWFTLASTRAGMPLSEASVNRQAFVDYDEYRLDPEALALQTEHTAPALQRRDVLFEAPIDRFRGGLSLGYGQIMGGPDEFILYQLSANYSADYFFGRGAWLSGTVSGNLLNNYDRFDYDAPSNLPRVRTDLRRYMTESDITVPNLQLTVARRLSPDVYGMAYAGMLEHMYGGGGGEVLYRPFGQPWALGMDVNWVRQRDFDQLASFRDYDVVTGHATLYYRFGREQRVQAALSAGHYLAGDWGGTLDVARVFDNGVTMGAYATVTNVSSETFGEGRFDKGFYVSIPFDLLLPDSTRSRATVAWSPYVRDGGARLGRRYALYVLTSERDRGAFFDGLERMDR